jgi:acyl carrier protein
MQTPEVPLSLYGRVSTVVAEVLRIDQTRVTPQSRFGEDLGADSLDKVSLLMALEDEFEGEISELEAQNLFTVEQVVALMNTKIKQAVE